METNTWIVFWQSFFKFLITITPLLIPLVAVYLGWKLGNKNYVKQLLLDTLKQKFDALHQIKSVIENIPPHLNKRELIDRLNSDSNFRGSLIGRLIRLFGLRNELTPFLEAEFISLVDEQLEPLFITENGTYTFREEKIEEFVNCTKIMQTLVVAIEKKLTREYKNQLK